MALSVNEISIKIKQAIESPKIKKYFDKGVLDIENFISEAIGINLKYLDGDTGINIITALNHVDFTDLRIGISSIKISLGDDGSSKNLYKNIILPLLAPDSTFTPNILIDTTCSSDTDKHEIQILSIKTGHIQYAEPQFAPNDALYKAFYNKVVEFGNAPITDKQLCEIVEAISPQRESQARYYPTLHKILDILSQVSWNEILYNDSQDNPDISVALHKMHDAIQVPSQIYSLKESNDLYFNMTRVTDQNKQKWLDIALVENTGTNAPGASGFLGALPYYDNPNTEVWVAFISNKLLTDPNEVDNSSIEMFVTVTTSEHSTFTAHMGITRSGFFPKFQQHKNISTKLHSFAAKFMLEQHPEKMYMLTVPTKIMREIIVKEFKNEEELLNKVFIGDSRTKYPESTIEENQKTYDINTSAVKEKGKNASEDLVVSMYTHLLNIHLLEQKSAMEQGKKSLPIHIDQHDYEFDFIVKDQENKIQQTITPKEQSDEFAWFFENTCQWGNISSSIPILTCDLKALASLGDFHREIALVGEVPATSLEATTADLAV